METTQKRIFKGQLENIVDTATECAKSAPREKFNYLVLFFFIATVACNTAYFFFYPYYIVRVIGGVLAFMLWHGLVRVFGFSFLALCFAKRGFNVDNAYFREKRFERPLYNFFRVKKWKRFYPTYYKRGLLTVAPLCMPNKSSIIYNMCLREFSHFLFSLATAPAFLILFYTGFNLWLFLGLLALHLFLVGYIDIIAIIIQRYNRPRMLRLWEIEQRGR